MATKSDAELLASLPQEKQDEFYASLSNEEAHALMYSWEFFARKEQLPPEGNWKSWLILAGRGFGKTRAGAEWVRSMVCGPTPDAPGKCRRIAIVGETAKDTNDVMVKGDSGLLAIHPPEFMPLHEPSKCLLTWPNGATATTYNATEPDQLRGPQFDGAWCDEIAKWDKAQETFDNIQLCLRLGKDPRQIITTTPRPVSLIINLLNDESCIITRGSTYDNRANMAPSFFREIEKRYEGTRLGRQELYADVLLDNPGALWKAETIEMNRVTTKNMPELKRVVVAIDPAVNDLTDATDETSETGIICAGVDHEDTVYIIQDVSIQAMPDGWARRAISAYDLHAADRIVAEINQGGAMVEQTIRAVRGDISYQGVRASKGKIARAEPVSALYEQGRVKHVGVLPELENQMLQFVQGKKIKADRVDALVWAVTSLLPSTAIRVRSDKDFSGDVWDVGRGYNDFGFFDK